MRVTLSIKTLFRAPMKTLLMFMLLTATTFMFVSNITDYALTSRALGRAVNSYHGLFSVDYGTPDDVDIYDAHKILTGKYLLSESDNRANYDGYFDYDTSHQRSLNQTDIEKIMSLPYVTTDSERYMSAGITENILRRPTLFTENDFSYLEIDGRIVRDYSGGFSRGFYDATLRFVIEATYDEKVVPDPRITGMPGPLGVYGYDVTKSYNLCFSDIKLLVGNPEWFAMPLNYTEDGADGQIAIGSIWVAQEHFKSRDSYNNVMWPNASMDVIMWNDMGGTPIFYRNNALMLEDINELVPGERYIITGRVDRHELGVSKQYKARWWPVFQIGDDTLYDWWPYIYSLEGQPNNYLELDEFAPLRELIQVTNDDLYTFDVVYTDDMRTIRRVWENRLVVTEGRALTSEDSASSNPVCVVSEKFLEDAKLQIGDKLELRLGDKLFEQFAWLGAIASLRDRYADNFTEVELEIVGSYIDPTVTSAALRESDLYWAYSDQTVFVPLSFLPETADVENHEFKPGEISFVIGDPRDVPAFIRECVPQLEAMGLTVNVTDMGWSSFENQIALSQSLGTAKLIAFGAAMLISLGFVVYLFILRKRRDYAIMRALGTSRYKSNRTLFAPLILLGTVAVLTGSTAAKAYSAWTAVNTLEDYAEISTAVDTSVPLIVPLLAGAAELALLALATVFGLLRLGKLQPLELLQGNVHRKTKSKLAALTYSAPVPAIDRYAVIPQFVMPEKRRYNAVCHVISYITKHSHRAATKSLLSIILAALLAGAMGQFTAVRTAYTDLYQGVDVKGLFVNGVPYQYAERVVESGYSRASYYERLQKGEIYVGKSEVFDDDETYPIYIYMTSNLGRVTTSDIKFLDEYNSQSFVQNDQRLCILPASLMNELGIELGDSVLLNEYDWYSSMVLNDSIVRSYDEYFAMYQRHGVICKIAGRIESGDADQIAFISIESARKHFRSWVGSAFRLDIAEFTLADYHKADEFRQYAINLLYNDRSGSPRFFMDTSAADNIYKIYLLVEALYPIALIAALLIGGLLPGLIIMQTAKDASIMRVLGTTKMRTRSMLALEQMLLCAIGLALTLTLLLAFNGGAVREALTPITRYAVLHLVSCTAGAVTCAVAVTKRNILELLQVKE